MTEGIFCAGVAYLFVAGMLGAAPAASVDRLETAERVAIGAFWPLVLAYLALSGLGKLAQRLGQEDD